MLLSCDTMVALPNSTRHGQTLFAKNSDRPEEECQPLVHRSRAQHAPDATVRCQFVELPQVTTTYEHVGSRPYWCWGYEHGFNEHQVVIGNEGLGSKFPEFQEPKLVGMELVRLGLERGRSASEAVEVMVSLISKFGQGQFRNGDGVRTYDNGYIVADPHEAYVIETAGHEWAVKRVESALGISNIHSIGTDWDRLSPLAESHAKENGWYAGGARFNFAEAYCDFPARASGRGLQRSARSCGVLNSHTGENRCSDHDCSAAGPLGRRRPQGAFLQGDAHIHFYLRPLSRGKTGQHRRKPRGRPLLRRFQTACVLE